MREQLLSSSSFGLLELKHGDPFLPLLRQPRRVEPMAVARHVRVQRVCRIVGDANLWRAGRARCARRARRALVRFWFQCGGGDWRACLRAIYGLVVRATDGRGEPHRSTGRGRHAAFWMASRGRWCLRHRRAQRRQQKAATALRGNAVGR